MVCGLCSLKAAAGAVLVLNFAPTTSLAGSGLATLSEPTASDRLDIAARKGTRNYRPEDADVIEQRSQDVEAATTSTADAIEQCMSMWDPATHMTRDQWRETCKRNTRNRTPDRVPVPTRE